MDDETKQYCVIIKIGGGSIGRARSAAPGIQAMIERWSKNDMVLISFERDASMIAVMFRSTKPPAMMRSEFDGAQFSDNTDSIIIFEATTPLEHLGFGSVATWMQRIPD